MWLPLTSLSFQARAGVRFALRHVRDLIGPRTGRIHQRAGKNDPPTAACSSRSIDHSPSKPSCSHDARPRRDDRAPIGRVAGIENNKARVIDPAIVIGEPAVERRLQCAACRITPEVDGA